MKKITRFKLWIILVNVFLIAAILYGIEFVSSPYRKLPENDITCTSITWGHRVVKNQYGFRERDFLTPKPADVFRVVVLGDSLTWGVGLDVSERYTAIAERLLSKAFPFKKIEVLNLGKCGLATTHERDILRDYKGILEPDLIVIGFCLNDTQPKYQSYSVEREKLRNSIIGLFFNRLRIIMHKIRLRFIGQMIENSLYKTTELAGLIPDWMTSLQRTYEISSNEWQDFVQALRDIKSMSDSLNIPLPLFIILNQGYPDKPNKPTDYSNPDDTVKQFLRWYHQAEKAAEDVGFITYNHETDIAYRLNNKSLGINMLDSHPSADLNVVYGEKLYTEIAKQILKKYRCPPLCSKSFLLR